MATIIEQQVALDEALVPSIQRLRIGRSNFRLPSDIQSKESTLQLVYDVLRRCPFFKAFLVTADVPKVYMQEFWATAYVHQRSIRFKMNNKKHIVELELFREMLHICPRIPGQAFAELPFEEEILEFIRFLGHGETIRTLTDININKLYQPWRSFASIINKCLTGKSSGYDSLRLSQAQILWGLYHTRSIDYAFLIWEDFLYQVEHKNQKKSNEMYYLRFTKMILGVDVYAFLDGSLGTDLVVSLRTDLDGSLGTDIDGSSGTDIDGSSGTDLVGSLRTNLDGSSGTDLDGSSGTDLVGSLRTDLDGSLGTDLDGSLRTDLVRPLGNQSSLTTLQPIQSVTDLTHQSQTMATTIEQQVALDEALVPSIKMLRIGRSKFRFPSDIQSKESTLQLVYDVLRRCPFFKAFLVTADVPEVYIQEFWATAYVHQHSIRYKINNKKHTVDLESFREMLHICPRIPGQAFAELPFKEEILEFIRFLRHGATIRTLTDININKLYQPWRSFTAIINKCLTGKSSSYDSLRLSQAQILWGLYHTRSIDYAFLIWEDFVYQVEHTNQKKSNEMYYPRFTKVIIHYFMSKDSSIPRRNKINWHYVRDDSIFSTIKVVSRHQNTQQYGAMLPIELTNDEIRNTKAYKEYYACATEEAAPKPKASARRKRSGSDTSITPPTATTTLTTTDDEETDAQEKDGDDDEGDERGESDDGEEDDAEDKYGDERDDDDDEQEIARINSDSDETKEEESFDPIPRTPEDNEDDGNGEEDQSLKDGDEEMLNEEEEADELYRDVEINQGREIQLSQDIEDSHVTLTPVNPDDRLKSLEANFPEYIQTNPFAEAVSNILVAADLSEMELKKILIENMEGNKSIQRLNEQRNLYKALVDAYEADKIILDSYGETVILKKKTMKGLCTSLIELDYHLEEVYKATTYQLDWVNLEGQQYPHNLLQPLLLIPDNRGRRVIPFAYFINNDLEYLRGGASSRKYTTSVTKTKAAYYENIKWIEDLVPRSMWIQEPLNYDKHALWGVSHWGRKHQ
nr:hypothetical protein [Tanacetum cinerariifolium]